VDFAVELSRVNQGLSEALEQRLRSEQARDRAMADLSRSRQLESVGRLAGGVAHEFNNLLQVILGHTDLLLTEVLASRPLADGLQQIDRAGRRAAELTKQLLLFARREPQEAAVVDVASAVSEGLRLMKPALKKKTRVDWSAPDVRLLVAMDGLRFDQILLNLLLNADLAMADGGVIELRVWEAAAGEFAGAAVTCEQRSVVLTIADQGCGMSEETLSRVFDPFFSTRGPAAGTGLGLSLVYGLMKQCGGQIHLSSEVDRGTTVTLIFPSVV
jgi:signal transduction histidine kinase